MNVHSVSQFIFGSRPRLSSGRVADTNLNSVTAPFVPPHQHQNGWCSGYLLYASLEAQATVLVPVAAAPLAYHRSSELLFRPGPID